MKALKILIVDDSKSILRTLGDYFEAAGYAADTTTNPLKAMELVEEQNYHIVITDISMPEMSGLDLLKKIKTYNGFIHVIVMTGFTTTTNLMDALRRGAYDIIFKPIEDMGVFLKLFKDIEKRIDHWYELLSITGAKEHGKKIRCRKTGKNAASLKG